MSNVTDIMTVYKIATEGEEVRLTEVRKDETGMAHIVRLTGHRYNGVTYKRGLDKSDPNNWRLIFIPVG